MHTNTYIRSGLHRCLIPIILILLCLLPLVALADTLAIQGIHEGHEAYQSFLQEHPELDLSCETAQAIDTTAAFVDALMTRQFNYDVFLVRTAFYDYQHLLSKGFCEMLSHNDKLSAQVARMYPIIRDQLSFDDRIYGIPGDINLMYLCYWPDAWVEAGYVAEDVPSSMEELCAFLEQWVERLDSDPDPIYDICVNNSVSDYSNWLVNLFFEYYITHYQYIDQPLQFDTPIFRDLLVRFKNVGQALNQSETNKGETNLFSYISSNDIQCLEYIIPLRLTANDQIYIKTAMKIYCINPNSENKEMAFEFMEYLLASLEKKEAAKIYIDANEPVLDKHYESNLSGWDVQQSTLEERLKSTTDPVAILEIEDALNRHVAARENIESRKYDITSEQLQTYQEKAEYIYLPPPSIFNPSLADGQFVQDLLQRYLLDSMEAGELIDKLDSIAKMIEAESE